MVCVLSPSEDNTEQILKEHNVKILRHDLPGRKVRDVDAHIWGLPTTYTYMSKLRNTLIEAALGMEADYFLSLDSDVILPPDAIKRLLDYSTNNHPGVIAPAVNMAQGAIAWNTMSWVDRAHPSLSHRPVREPLGGLADVVMAAMLLDKVGLEARWQTHPQGEDVGFCLDARAKEVPLWWVPEIKCDHRMRRV